MRSFIVCVSISGCCFLGSCQENEGQAELIKELNEEIEDIAFLSDTNEELNEELQEKVDHLTRENLKLQNELLEKERHMLSLQSKLSSPENEEHLLGGEMASYLSREKTSSDSSNGRALEREALEDDSLKVSKDESVKAIVLITGKGGKGTGFFVKVGRTIYLYTAAHVLSGNSSLKIRSLDGREYKKFGKIEVAHGLDLVRMPVLSRVPFALSLPKSGAIQVDTEIVAIGNAGGGSVFTHSKGAVNGIGPDSFEISAEVIPGSSGGPILAPDGRTVYGAVTHGMAGEKDVWARQTRYANVRRFGARLDRKIKWHQASLSTFLKEKTKIDQLDKGTRLLFAISALGVDRDGFHFRAEISDNLTVLDILNENLDVESVRGLLNIQKQMRAQKIKEDIGMTKRRLSYFYSAILKDSDRQVSSLQGYGLTPYHKDLAKASYRWRDDANRAVKASMKRLEL